MAWRNAAAAGVGGMEENTGLPLPHSGSSVSGVKKPLLRCLFVAVSRWKLSVAWYQGVALKQRPWPAHAAVAQPLAKNKM